MGNNSSRAGRHPPRGYSYDEGRSRSKAHYGPQAWVPNEPPRDYQHSRSHSHDEYGDRHHRYYSQPGSSSRRGYPYFQPAPVSPLPFPSAPLPANIAPIIPNVPAPTPRMHGHTRSNSRVTAPTMQMPTPHAAPSPSMAQPVFVPSNNVPYPTADAPVIPPQLQNSPSRFAQPVIPSMPIPAPATEDYRMPPGEPLAPGQYGPPRPASRARSRSPQPQFEHRRHQSHNHRRDFDDASHSRRENPLPPPPKDVFELSPYVRLLNDLRLPPEESTLRRHGSTSHTAIVIPATVPVSHHDHGGSQHTRGSSSSREKKQRKGLFRSLSHRLGGGSSSRHDRHHSSDHGHTRSANVIPNVQPVIYTVPPGMPGEGVSYIYNAPSSAHGGTPSAAEPMRMPSPAPSQRIPSPVPAPPPPPPPIIISRDNEYVGLTHYSLHPVHYNRKLYPTGFHLFEALKFMQGRPEIAEHIRNAGEGPEGMDRVRQIVAENRDFVRGDWEHVVLSMMEEVLYHKFILHSDLRSLLLRTGEENLLYSDPRDDFWGDGPNTQGANELGRVLMNIRDKLRDEGFF